MGGIRFLSVANALDIHAETIAIEGGCTGIRDLALLESALATPRQEFGGVLLHPDLAAMAAAYLYHICCNHPFLDGNKRVAAISALVFLAANGIKLEIDERVYEDTVLRVARGEMPKAELTVWLRAQIAAQES